MIKKILLALVTVFVIIPLTLNIWALFFVGQADYDALSSVLANTEQIEYMSADSNSAINADTPWITFKSRQTPVRAGLIFHPGGFVEAESYGKVIHEISKSGLFSVIVPGPMNNPIADRFAADRVMAAYPEINHWFIGGHSQGGAVANLYTLDRPNLDKHIGLIFLGYFANDKHSLAGITLPTISIWGDRDGQAHKFDGYIKNLPAGSNTLKIEGGNHRQFANYGLHFGDGEATISREEQQQIAINALNQFIEKTLRDKNL